MNAAQVVATVLIPVAAILISAAIAVWLARSERRDARNERMEDRKERHDDRKQRMLLELVSSIAQLRCWSQLAEDGVSDRLEQFEPTIIRTDYFFIVFGTEYESMYVYMKACLSTGQDLFLKEREDAHRISKLTADDDRIPYGREAFDFWRNKLVRELLFWYRHGADPNAGWELNDEHKKIWPLGGQWFDNDPWWDRPPSTGDKIS